MAEMKYCAECDRRYRSSRTVCRYCGTPFEVKDYRAGPFVTESGIIVIGKYGSPKKAGTARIKTPKEAENSQNIEQKNPIRAKIAKVWAKWCRICRADPERDFVYQWLTGTQWPPQSWVKWEKEHPEEAGKILEDWLNHAEQNGIETGFRRLDLNRSIRSAVLYGLSMGRWFR